MAERRLFFALWPDDAVRGRLAGAAQTWLGTNDGRLIRAANLHLTLAYLGPVNESRISELRAALASIEVAPTTMTIDRGAWWRKPRIAWLAPASVPAPLVELETALWAALAPLAWRRDHAEFKPHISVARKQTHAPPDYPAGPIDWRYDGFVLCESVSTPDGVRYDVIGRWPG